MSSRTFVPSKEDSVLRYLSQNGPKKNTGTFYYVGFGGGLRSTGGPTAQDRSDHHWNTAGMLL